MNGVPKFFLYLILVWSVCCASGLGIFLFEIYGPQMVQQTAYDGPGVLTTVGFFAFLWAVPSGAMFTIGRRRRELP